MTQFPRSASSRRGPDSTWNKVDFKPNVTFNFLSFDLQSTGCHCSSSISSLFRREDTSSPTSRWGLFNAKLTSLIYIYPCSVYFFNQAPACSICLPKSYFRLKQLRYVTINCNVLVLMSWMFRNFHHSWYFGPFPSYSRFHLRVNISRYNITYYIY